MTAACAAPSVNTDASEKLDALFEKWNKTGVPGCAVGIERAGEIPIVRTFGSADLEHDIAIDQETVFEAGSVSKQFTAAATLLLIEQRKIAFDDDVRKYIPELPDYTQPVTIRELLGHTSGLRDWEGVVDIAGWPVTTRTYSNEDVLEIAARQKNLNHSPGAAFSYTNTGYILLALIVERVSGQPFPQFTEKYIFAPLQMTHTQWRNDFRAVVKNRAVAYDSTPACYRQLMPFENVIGAGGLLTTVGDLLKWNDAIDKGSLGNFVTTELQRATTLTDGSPTNYARGLYLSSFHGIRKIWHSGETAGYESFLARYPDEHTSVALLCNAGNEVEIDTLGDKIAAIYLQPLKDSKLPKLVSPKIKLKTADLQNYAGNFFDRRLASQIQLEVVDGILRRASDRMELTPIGPAEFRTSISTIRFDGKDRFLRNFDDGRRAEFERVNPWHPSDEELSQFVGRYRSDEAMATYVIEVQHGQLVFTTEDRRWDRIDLEPVAIDTFTKTHHAYHFLRDTKGHVSGIEVSNGWEHVYGILFRRIAD